MRGAPRSQRSRPCSSLIPHPSSLVPSNARIVRMDFTPPWWLRNPHAQTVWGRLTRSRRLVPFRRESLATPDGDELLLDHVDAAAPRVHFLLMHGLEGSSYSVYMQGLLKIIA